MGYITLSRQWAPGAGIARLPDARRRYLRNLCAKASAFHACACLRGFRRAFVSQLGSFSLAGPAAGLRAHGHACRTRPPFGAVQQEADDAEIQCIPHYAVDESRMVRAAKIVD